MITSKYLLGLAMLVAFQTQAQNFTPTDAGSKVHFVIKNFGISTGGDFSELKGTIIFDPENLAGSRFDVTVAANTIDTDNKMRDNSLLEQEYFYVSKFPVIRLASTKISATNKTPEGFYFFNGELTIKGVTKSISFPFQAKKSGDGYLFTGNFDIDRLQFGVGGKSIVLSNKVSVSLSVAGKKS